MGRSKTEENKSQDENSDLQSVVLSMKASLDLLSAKFDETVDALTTSVDKLLTDSKISSKSLLSLGVMVNDREQHSRNFSIRISGLKMPLESRKSAISTSQSVYKSTLAPILSLAVEDGTLPKLPDMWALIEYAHVIPSKKNGVDAPDIQVLVRFQSRLFRDLIFKYKRAFLDMKGLKDIFISEDLTQLNFRKLMELKKDPKIKSVWSNSGKIFFTEKSDPDTRKNI